ncbi:MAG: RNA polymerase sigma factor [Dorea sp.]|jgi:RNA polymerase sigma factor (sigma-70 family)|nr:RNA polymerase sigma factor [Dorea sp.]
MPANKNLERLIDVYGDSLLRMCFLYLKDYHLAEDAVQETFIKVIKAYDTFEHKSSEKTWITRIAINTCKNIMRNHWFQTIKNNMDTNIPEICGNPIDDFCEKASVTGAILKLKADDRQAVVLYYYQEMSVKEIAKITGKTQSAVMQRLNRARKRLKKILMEDGYDENRLETGD